MTPVRAHTRRKPYEAIKQATTARLLDEVNRYVEQRLLAALRTLPANVRRLEKAGRL